MKKDKQETGNSIALDDISRIEDSTHNESSSFDVNGDSTNEEFEQIDLKIEKDEILNNDISFGNFNSNKRPRKIGNLYTCLYLKDGDPLIVIGPHWPFYACLSTTITIICLSFFYFLWDLLGSEIKTLGMLIYMAQIASYTITFLKNPGIPKKRKQLRRMPKKIDKGYKYCDQCHIVINLEEQTSHCDDCNVCIIGKYFYLI
jgi:hypothetical protein